MAKNDDQELTALLDTAARLEDEYTAALAEVDQAGGRSVPAGHPSRRRLQRAMQNLADERAYWRSIGEAAPDDHPGSRWNARVPGHPEAGVVMVKVENNDGSAA